MGSVDESRSDLLHKGESADRTAGKADCCKSFSFQDLPSWPSEGSADVVTHGLPISYEKWTGTRLEGLGDSQAALAKSHLEFFERQTLRVHGL